ncbi:MAG: electron transporter RnfE [Sulfurovum sp.]|nr:MAG: electron transporter RnfE [Sulfurovum sp.]
MNYFNHGWGMGFGWLIPLLIIAVIFYGFQKKKKSSAQDILDKRFANGDLSIEEYEEKSKILQNKKLKG